MLKVAGLSKRMIAITSLVKKKVQNWDAVPQPCSSMTYTVLIVLAHIERRVGLD